MIRYFLLVTLIFLGFQVNGQFKEVIKLGTPASDLKKPLSTISPNSAKGQQGISMSKVGQLNIERIQKPIKAYQFDHNKMPILIKGWLKEPNQDLRRQARAYLDHIAELYQISDASDQLVIEEVRTDDIGMQHIRVKQVMEKVPVFAGEMILHAKNGRIEHAMGRGFPTPELATYQPSLSLAQAERKVIEKLKSLDHFVKIPNDQLDLFKMKQVKLELVIYHEEENARKERLAYYVQAYENLASFETYFMDAHTGEVIHSHSNICKFHENSEHLPPDGPTTAVARDLNGTNRTIDTYESGGNFFMINTTKPNFSDAQSSIPNEVVGGIITLDAQNKSPENDDFSYFHVATADNLSWNDRSTVSAHYNANIAYDYFRNTHGRNAIDGSGGNVFSIVNVTDEDELDMDNAYWNGLGMYYGNGKTDFLPLAGGLDVAGHEMSHGVVQTSANLNYENESGALNESFADVFGVMMDRNDYQIGEDVVTNSFPTGALRDLSNPNNGGSQLGDIGWQPMNVSQQYFGSLDNGGVHINSGIPNHAFYLFAEMVGKDKAEKVYYRALTEYLTRSSRFVDARNAVVQSATDLFGATEANAAKNAFSQVGIGEGSGGDYTNDAQVNPGNEYLIYADDQQSKFAIVNASLETVLDPASEFAPISLPSVTDDGSFIFYVNSDNQIAYTTINWDTGDVNAELWSEQEIWSNVVISKDGNRLAAVESAQSNRIQVFDFSKGEWYKDQFGNFGFELYNPTFTEGVSTGDAKFADAMEFDLSSEVLMYDVYSEITGNFGEGIGYWDIGFLNVWNNSSADWGDGDIFKLFSTLADGISVGNPTFAKNSPYIIAFDYIEGNENAIIGANIETGDLVEIFENSSLGYPSYGGTDGQLIFTNETTFETDVFLIDLQESKIAPVVGSEGLVISDAKWGVVFRNGSRVLSSVDEVNYDVQNLKIFPNPSSEFIQFTLEIEHSGRYNLELYDMNGKMIRSEKVQLSQGESVQMIKISALPPGQYSVKVSSQDESHVGIFSKQ